MTCLGQQIGPTTHFYADTRRVMIKRFRKIFECYPGSPNAQQLVKDNGLKDTLLAIMNLDLANGEDKGSESTLVLAISDPSVVNRLLAKGISLRGTRYTVVEYTGKWDYATQKMTL